MLSRGRDLQRVLVDSGVEFWKLGSWFEGVKDSSGVVYRCTLAEERCGNTAQDP